MSQALAPQILTKFYDLFTMVLGLEATPRDVLKSIRRVTAGNRPLQDILQTTCNAAMQRDPTHLPQTSEDLAQQALRLYGDVLTHVFAQTSPQALENLSPKHLHHFALAIQVAVKNPAYIGKLVDLLTSIEPDAEIMEYHDQCLSSLFKYTSRSSRMQGAVTRILAYSGGVEPPAARFYNDLKYVQAQIARQWGCPRPINVLNLTPSNLSGLADLAFDKNSRVFMPVTYLYPYNKRGMHRSGLELLLVMCHEIGHIFEMTEVEHWAKSLTSADPEQPLFKGILRLAQNSDTLGLYIPSSVDFYGYNNQLRERHANLFADKCVKTLKAAMP